MEHRGTQLSFPRLCHLLHPASGITPGRNNPSLHTCRKVCKHSPKIPQTRALNHGLVGVGRDLYKVIQSNSLQ